MPLLLKALGPGDCTGRYRIERVLHQSARSTVYLAEHVVLGIKAVVKLSDGVNTEIEAEALSLMQSPYVPTLYDRGVLGEDYAHGAYFIAEYVEGEPLSHVLRERRRLGAFEAVRTALQALSALTEAHRQGIVHGDIKPDNLILSSKDGTGRCVLIDFGSARGVHPPQSTVVSRPIQATPEYAAPEVVSGGAPTQASDLFSLGCVLFESLSGRRPEFDALGLREPLAELVPVHPALSDVLAKALALDSRARYESASAFGRALLEPGLERVAAFGGVESTEVSRPQETLDTVDMTKPGEQAFVPVSFRGPTANDMSPKLLSTGKPRVWFFSDDPAIDQTTVQVAIAKLQLDAEVEVLDTDARERKRESGLCEQPPWVVVFGELHALINDSLLDEVGRHGEVARILVSTHDNLELLRTSVNTSGLDGRYCVTSASDELVALVKKTLERVRGIRLQYDALRVAVRDTQHDIRHVKQCFERMFA